MLKLNEKLSNPSAGKEFDSFVYYVNSIKGYRALGEYVDAITKVEMRCPKGHTYEVKPNDFKRGIRCPRCANRIVGEKI